MASDAYQRVIWHGHTLNKRTVAMLEAVERRVGFSLYVMQGSYNRGGVQASSGTHDGGGAVDVSPNRYPEVVLAARNVGFAAWHRPYLAGEWDEHIHMIAIGDREMSSGAADQVRYYYEGLDGLADHARDSNPYRPDPIPVFQYHGGSAGDNTPWDTGDVYVSKLHYGAHGSDSVKRLQFRLKGHTEAQTKSLVVDGDYGDKTKRAVKKWQNQAADEPPKDGTFVPLHQAHRMLGGSYKIHNDGDPAELRPDRAKPRRKR